MDYNQLMDLIASEESPSGISDAIKDILYAKSVSKIEDITPEVAASLFNSSDESDE